MRNSALALTLATIASLLAQSSSSYRLTHTYTLGGDGSWDYIVPDPPNHRLFIARQNRVMVVDEDKGTLLGEVTGIQGAHGTAVAQACELRPDRIALAIYLAAFLLPDGMSVLMFYERYLEPWMRGAQSRVTSQVPRTLTVITRSQVAISISSNILPPIPVAIAALLTKP